MGATGLDDGEAGSQKRWCREKVGIGGRVWLEQGVGEARRGRGGSR